MDILVENFLKQRALPLTIMLNEPLYDSIYLLEKSHKIIYELAEKNLDRLVKEVAWPSMHDMYNRNYEYCCGALGCFVIAQIPSSEALCRTAIEGAVNLHYVSLGDSMGKQISYFKNYLETERKQNRNWKLSVEQSDYPISAKAHHLDKIAEKNTSLDHYETMLRQSLRLANIDFDAVTLKWPSIFDRFREIGDEVGYRTVYAALCSQAHNDAEDILNGIMSRVTLNIDGLEEAQRIEQYNFSLYMILTALGYNVKSAAMYISKFDISSKTIIDLYFKVMETLSVVVENGPRMIKEQIKVSESKR